MREWRRLKNLIEVSSYGDHNFNICDRKCLICNSVWSVSYFIYNKYSRKVKLGGLWKIEEQFLGIILLIFLWIFVVTIRWWYVVLLSQCKNILYTSLSEERNINFHCFCNAFILSLRFRNCSAPYYSPRWLGFWVAKVALKEVIFTIWIRKLGQLKICSRNCRKNRNVYYYFLR